MDSTTALILAQATSGRMTPAQLMQTGFFPTPDDASATAIVSTLPTLASRQRRDAQVRAEVEATVAIGDPLSPASALADLRRSGVLQPSPLATASAAATPQQLPLAPSLRPPPPPQPQSAIAGAPTPASAAASPHIALGSSGRQLQLQSGGGSGELLSSLFDEYRARHQSATAMTAASAPASPPAAASMRASPGTHSSPPASHPPKRLHFAPHTTSPAPMATTVGAGGRAHSSPVREHYSLQLAPMDSSAAATAAAASSTALHAGTPAMPAYAYSFTPARPAAPAGNGLPLSSPLHLAATPWTSVFLSRLADEDKDATGAASSSRAARGASASASFDSPLAPQLDPGATQEQLAAQVNALAQEVETLKAFALRAQEQHVHATHAQTAQHQQALQSLQQSHALELRQLSTHSEALQAAREQQAQALEDARSQAAARAQQVLDESRQHDRVAMEQQREQLARDMQAREHAVQMLERALRQKESDLDEVLARAQRLCQDKEAELARQAQEAQLALDQRAREQEQKLQRDFADRERSLLEQLSQARASESRALSELDARRQQLERDWAHTERERLAALAERETALADQVAAKLASVERERQHALDGVRQQQALIDAGNENKLRTILHQYKTRVAHLESELRDARAAQLRAQDGVILQGEHARAKLAGCDAVLAEYKVLVGEQSAQLELQRSAHAALEQELAEVRSTYEQLIVKIGEAESIKARTLVAEELRARDLEIGTMRRAHDELMREHSRLQSSARLAADSALLAEGETERLRLENRRLVAEQERMQVLLYGHRGHTRTASASSATGTGARTGTATGKKSIKKVALPPPALSPATSSLRPSATNGATAGSSSRPGAHGKLTVASLHGSTASQVDFSDALAHGSRA